MADLDALGKLPLFRWRDQAYPVTERRVSFAHEGASHRLQYRNDDFIEQLGAHSLTFSYTLPMRQGIASGPYRDLFTTGYPLLFAAMRDREKGVLDDPVLGTFVCVPTSWSDDLDVAKRDGTDVRVEFTHSPEPDEVEDLRTITIQGLRNDAGALDQALKSVDWQQEPSPEPSMDVLNAISGVGAQIGAQAGRVVAALHDFAYKLEKIEDQIDRLQNPDVWPAKQAVRRNRATAVELAKRTQDPTQQIVATVNNYRRGISAIASENRMTVQELLRHNPGLARLPFVPPGETVLVLADRMHRAG